MLVAAGALPIMAGLGALIGGLVNEKNTQEGRDARRVSAHQPFLLNLVCGDGTSWRQEINRASNEQMRALTSVVHERRPRASSSSVVSINCGVNSKTYTPTERAKVLSLMFGRNPTVGFKNEKNS